MNTVRQTHCQHGHPLADPNLVYRASGRRECATCHRDRERQAANRKRRRGCTLDPDRTARIPGGRLVPLIDDYLASTGTLQGLSAGAVRTISRVRRGESLGLTQVDHLLVALDRVDAWYCELDDLYFEGAAA